MEIYLLFLFITFLIIIHLLFSNFYPKNENFENFVNNNYPQKLDKFKPVKHELNSNNPFQKVLPWINPKPQVEYLNSEIYSNDQVKIMFQKGEKQCKFFKGECPFNWIKSDVHIHNTSCDDSESAVAEAVMKDGGVLDSIKVVKGGKGYQYAPKVEIDGAEKMKIIPVATAYIDKNGSVTRIELEKSVSGFVETPKISVESPEKIGCILCCKK